MPTAAGVQGEAPFSIKFQNGYMLAQGASGTGGDQSSSNSMTMMNGIQVQDLALQNPVLQGTGPITVGPLAGNSCYQANAVMKTSRNPATQSGLSKVFMGSAAQTTTYPISMLVAANNRIVSCGLGSNSNVCLNSTSSNPGCEVPAAAITNFRVNSTANLHYNQDTVPPAGLNFSWGDSNVASLAISPAPGVVTGTSAATAAPTAAGTTTYTLSAVAVCGEPTSASVNVQVDPCNCDATTASTTCTPAEGGALFADSCSTNKCNGTYVPAVGDPQVTTKTAVTCSNATASVCGVAFTGTKAGTCGTQPAGCVNGNPYADSCGVSDCTCSTTTTTTTTSQWTCNYTGATNTCADVWNGAPLPPTPANEPSCCVSASAPGTCESLPTGVSCTGPTAVSISSWSGDMCAVMTDGTMKCWQPGGSGWGAPNRMGVGTTATTIPGIPATGLSQTAAGERSCAVVSGGLMCVGDNINSAGQARPYQQAGGGTLNGRYNYSNGTTSIGLQIDTHTDYTPALANMAVPNSLTDPSYWQTSAVQVSGLPAGSGVTKATNNCVVVGGNLQCWGEDFVGQFGNQLYGVGGLTNYEGDSGGGSVWGGSGNKGVVFPPVANVATPTTVIGGGVTDVASGGDLTCAVVSGGVQCAGLSEAGEAGMAPSYSQFTTNAHNGTNCAGIYGALSRDSVEQGMDDMATGASMGYNTPYTGYVWTDGFMHCSPRFNWIIGPGSGVIQVTVSKVMDTTVTQGLFACALYSNGTVSCWGNNMSGQLGNGSMASPTFPWWNEDNGYFDYLWFSWNSPSGTGPSATSPIQTTPAAPVFGPGSGVTSIHAGLNSVCAIKSDGTAWCWGEGDQLGTMLNTGFKYTVAPTFFQTGSWTDNGMGYSTEDDCGPGECSGSAPPCALTSSNPNASCAYADAAGNPSNLTINCDVESTSTGDPDDPSTEENATCGFTSPITYTNTISPVPVQVTAIPGPFTDVEPDVGGMLVNGHVFTWGSSFTGAVQQQF